MLLLLMLLLLLLLTLLLVDEKLTDAFADQLAKVGDRTHRSHREARRCAAVRALRQSVKFLPLLFEYLSIYWKNT